MVPVHQIIVRHDRPSAHYILFTGTTKSFINPDVTSTIGKTDV